MPPIRTPDQRLRVFISAVVQELAPERAAARDAVARLHLSPVLAELGARPYPPSAIYRAYLEQSDVMLGIYGRQYGWLGPGAAISAQEDEWERSAGKPRFVYLRREGETREPRLAALLERIASAELVTSHAFETPSQLAELVADDLAGLLTERFAESASGIAAEEPQAAAGGVAPLPVPATPLVGREGDLERLRRLLADPGVRLVTFVGPGGTGKTRLALAFASEAQAAGREVAFVPLAGLADPALVLRAIAAAVGLADEGGGPLQERLEARLADGRTLLLLDNLEHLLPVVPDLQGLLEHVSELTILATSRAGLRVRGEHVVEVAPLPLDDARRLFRERAEAVRGPLPADPATTAAVDEVCRRLDGLPLAIELAAARTRLLTPSQLAARLTHQLDVLSSGPADLPPRQRTLRATLDWSYDLLAPDGQALFRRMGIFAGPVSLEAIELVCVRSDGTGLAPLEVDLLEALDALAEQSLILQRESEHGSVRAAMLATVRDYARVRLVESGEIEAQREAHAMYFLRLAQAAAAELNGRSQALWLERLAAAHDDLRAALDYLGGLPDLSRGLLLAAAMVDFWRARGFLTEGRQRLGDLLTRTPAEPLTVERMRVLRGSGALALWQTDMATATTQLTEALREARELGQAADEAATLQRLAQLEFDLGELQQATELAEASIAIWKRLGNEWAVSTALNTLGGIANFSDDLPRAREVFEEMLALRRRLGDEAGIGVALANLALVEADAGNLQASEAMVRESAAIQLRLGDRQRWAVVSHNLGLNLMMQGRLEEAEAQLTAALATARELGDRHEMAFALADLAAVRRAAGHPDEGIAAAAEALEIAESAGVRGVVALSLEELGLSLAGHEPLATAWFWGAAQAVREATGYRRGKAEGERTLGELERVRAAADARAWADAEAEGRAAPQTGIRERAGAARARVAERLGSAAGDAGTLAKAGHG